MRRYLLLGAAAAVLSAAALPAVAATYVVTNTQIAGGVNAHIVGPGVNRTVRLGMMNFTVEGMVDPVELFCIDPYHTITVGNQDPPLTYNTEPFTHDFGGNTLLLNTIQQIAWLANYGVKSNSLFEERAVQGAIWRELSFSVTVTDQLLQSRIDELYALTNTSANVGPAWVSANGRQSFLPGVPEPSTWAMMILGFGAAGAMLRRRRTVVA